MNRPAGDSAAGEPPSAFGGPHQPFAAPSQDALVAQVHAEWPRLTAQCRCAGRYHVLWGVLRAVGRHRGIYTEAALLQRLAAPHLRDGAHVLIGGAADAASLELLLGAAADRGARGVRWSVADRCAAPLAAAEALGRQRGEVVHGVAETLESLAPPRAPQPPWDLVFVHYTLSFLGAAQRAAALARIAAGLAPHGRLVCSAKFANPANPGAADEPPTAWAAPLAVRIDTLFGAGSAVSRFAHEHLAAYAVAHAARLHAQPTPATLEAEFGAAGLEVLESHATPRSGSTLQGQSSRVLVAARRGTAGRGLDDGAPAGTPARSG